MSAEVFRHSGKVLGISKCFVWLPNLCCGPGVWGLYSWARHGHIETWAAYKVPLCPFVKTLFLRSNAILVVLNPTRCNLLLPGSHVHGTGAYQKGFGIRAACLHLHGMEAFKQMKTMRCGSMAGQVGPEVLVRPGYQGLESLWILQGLLLVQLKFVPAIWPDTQSK